MWNVTVPSPSFKPPFLGHVLASNGKINCCKPDLISTKLSMSTRNYILLVNLN